MNKLNTVRAAAVAASLLVVTACGSSSSSESTGTPVSKTAVTLTDYMIAPMDESVMAGTDEFDVVNNGDAPHNFSIRDSSKKEVAASKDLTKGQTDTLKVDLKAGSYQIYCSEPGHESLGMVGTLTVK